MAEELVPYLMSSIEREEEMGKRWRRKGRNPRLARTDRKSVV